MEIWASSNQKGGVGKTTTIVTLAALLAEQGNRVLVIDLDPHGSLTSYFGLDPDTTVASVADLFELNGNTSPFANRLTVTNVPNLFLLPASTRQATLDRRLASKGGMGLTLQQCLASWGGQFNYVLLDCPPTLGVLMVNALAACDRILIPVQTDFLALQGLRRMRRTIGMVAQSMNIVPRQKIIPTFYDHRTRASQIALKDLQTTFPEDLWTKYIPIDTKFRDASRIGLPLSMAAPNTHGVKAYRALLHELLHEIELDNINSYQEAV